MSRKIKGVEIDPLGFNSTEFGRIKKVCNSRIILNLSNSMGLKKKWVIMANSPQLNYNKWVLWQKLLR